MIIPNSLSPINMPGATRTDDAAAYLQRVAADGGAVADGNALITSVNRLKIPNNMGANKYDSATLVLNAAGGYKAGKIYALKPASGAADSPFARNSAAYRRNSTGVQVSEAVDVPLINYEAEDAQPRFAFEPSAINLIPNPIMQGATAGLPGSGPDLWGLAAVNGMSIVETDAFSQAGINFFKLKVEGVATSSGLGLRLQPYVFSDTNVSPNDYVNLSSFISLNNLATATPSVSGVMQLFNSVNAFIGQTNTNLTLSALIQRNSFSQQVTNIDAAFVRSGYDFFVVNGEAYSFEVVIGWPQFVRQRFESSFMRSTLSSLFTRAVTQFPIDDLQDDVFAANEGCFYLDLARMVSNGAGDAVLTLRLANNTEVVRFIANGVANQYLVNLPTLSASSAYNAGKKIAVAWNGTNVRISQGGSIVATINGALGAVDQLRYTGTGLLEAYEMLGYNAAPTDSDLNALTA